MENYVVVKLMVFVSYVGVFISSFFFVDIFSFFEFFMLLSLFPPGYFDFIYALLTGGVN